MARGAPAVIYELHLFTFLLFVYYTGRSGAASVIICPCLKMLSFSGFFGCRKCDFPLRHRGLRIAQFS
jgi:hypothetical protein